MRNLRNNVCTTLAALLGMISAGCTQEDIRWQDRVLPLPQEMEVLGHVTVRAGELRYRIQAKTPDPAFVTVRELLDSFAMGERETASVTLTLVLLDDFPGAVPAEIRERVQTLPNASQAYAIFPREDSEELVLAANTPVGLLYAAQTITQLVTAGQDLTPETLLTMPRVRITDWPDVEWRGSWHYTAYLGLGLNARWRFNIQNMLMDSWRGERPPGAMDFKRMGDRDSEEVRAYVRWARELGYTFLPSIQHLGLSGARGLQGISPAVYTKAHPPPKHDTARGFCWAPGQEIYTVLKEEMTKAAKLAMEFPEGGRHIEVALTEPEGTSCYCPSCDGEIGQFLEARAILQIFDEIRQEYPIRLIVLLTQGSRPANDRILALAAGRPDVGFGYYDGHLTYVIARSPMIPDYIEKYARDGGFVEVVLTLMPGRWDAEHPASLPEYIRTRGQEFSDKAIRAATHFDWYGHHFYYPLNMAAWGEYLWNAHGRSVADFARAYATITGIAEPDLFARWVKKADEASMELSVSQHMSRLRRAHFGDLPELRADDAHQTEGTLRPERAMRAASEALELARITGNEELRCESEFTLAAVKSIVLRNALQEALPSEERREEAERMLEQLDVCARVVLAAGYAWHDRAMDKRKALKEACGFVRAPVWLEHLPPRGGYPARTQFRVWQGVLHVTDTERMAASLAGIPDTRGEWAPAEIAYWERGDFEDRDAVFEIDVTDVVRPSGGHYLAGFQTLDGSGSTIKMELVGVDPESGEKRSILTSRAIWEMKATSAHNMFVDYLLRIPERKSDETLVLRVSLRSHETSTGSEGVVTLRRVWAWDEVPPDAIDALLEE